MSLADEFVQAQQRVTELSKAPDTETLLELYSLYKQGGQGDVTGKRPGMLDLKGRAKYDAWAKQKGKSPDGAMQAYVDLVNRLVERDG